MSFPWNLDFRNGTNTEFQSGLELWQPENTTLNTTGNTMPNGQAQFAGTKDGYKINPVTGALEGMTGLSKFNIGIQGVNAIAGLGQLGLGIAQYSQAKKAMDFNKRLAEKNLANQAVTVNERLGRSAFGREINLGKSVEEAERTRQEYLSGTHKHSVSGKL